MVKARSSGKRSGWTLTRGRSGGRSSELIIGCCPETLSRQAGEGFVAAWATRVFLVQSLTAASWPPAARWPSVRRVGEAHGVGPARLFTLATILIFSRRSRYGHDTRPGLGIGALAVGFGNNARRGAGGQAGRRENGKARAAGNPGLVARGFSHQAQFDSGWTKTGLYRDGRHLGAARR